MLDRPAAVHEMSAAMTTEKAAVVSTQAASTITTGRVATAVRLADPNAWFLGGGSGAYDSADWNNGTGSAKNTLFQSSSVSG